MKAKELKSKIKKILQEQFKAAPKMPEKIPASRKGATRMVRPNMTQNQTMRTKYADVKGNKGGHSVCVPFNTLWNLPFEV